MPRLEQDNELQFEADKTGMIHVRKGQSASKVLPGYGTEDFGVSAYEQKKYITTTGVLSAAGVATAGFLFWKFKDRISIQLQTLADYALLVREASRE